VNEHVELTSSSPFGLESVPLWRITSKPLNDKAKARLKSWATDLSTIQVGFSPTCQMHGYSGRWQVEATYEVYRRIQIKDPDYAVFSGMMILEIPANGEGGAGCAFGNLQVQVGNCYAEFEASDRVTDRDA